MIIRSSKRDYAETREISIETNVNCHAEGSCLISFGQTKLLCTASCVNETARFLRGTNKGWLTASYAMLPRSTHSRIEREVRSGKISGRTQEIQRLIGRSLRASLNLSLLGERQIFIDCDVLQADGGTRTAAISGGYVALALCINKLLQQGLIKKNPLTKNVAAISCGIMANQAIIDLDYLEDSNIDVDANFILANNDTIIEIQASAEGNSFNKAEFEEMYKLALIGCKKIFALQNEAINNS